MSIASRRSPRSRNRKACRAGRSTTPSSRSANRADPAGGPRPSQRLGAAAGETGRDRAKDWGAWRPAEKPSGTGSIVFRYVRRPRYRVIRQRCRQLRARGGAGQGFLPHDADLLRQRCAAHRARLHDGGRRRPDPVAPPARRAGPVPDRHRRARREDPAQRRAARHRPAAVVRPPGRDAWQPGLGDDRRRQRRLHPDHRAAAHGAGAGVPAAAVRRRRDLRGRLRGPYCVACEEFKLAGRAARGVGDYAGQKVCPIHGTPVEQLSRDATTSSGCPSTPIALLAHYEEHPEAVEPESARNEVLSFVQQGLHDLSITRSTLRLGHHGARGTRPTSSTSGSTRCSTTPPPSASATPTARTRSSSTRPGPPTSTWSARTSCASTR